MDFTTPYCAESSSFINTLNMAPSKSALKSIKGHLDKGNFKQAAEEAKEVVQQDNQNHTAFLFLGFACEKLGDLGAAENALSSAANLKPEDVQAYKGSINLYEKQNHLKIDQYHDVTFRLAQLYAEKDDREQCQNVVDKYETFAKKFGSPSQYRHALELIVPSSPLYQALEGRVLKPSLAYQRILESADAEEKDWISGQIAERRTRLGARIDQVTSEVKREAIPKFNVEDKYTALIDWTQDDDARHELEQKRFERMFDDLLVLPNDQKPDQRDKVLNAANGIVIIKQQFIHGWKVALEWVDAEELEDWDAALFYEYIEYFPEDGLSKVLRGFLASDASPFPPPEPDEDAEAPGEKKLSEAQQLILMNEGLTDSPESPLAHRIVAHTYLYLSEWQDAVKLAEKAQTLYIEAHKKYAVDLQNSIDGVNITLGNALIHHQSPRHHLKSKTLFEDLLSRKPKLTAALLGVGLIYEEDEQFSEAVKFLQPALDRDSENLRIQSELAWCKAKSGQLSPALDALTDIREGIEQEKTINRKMLSEVLYRIGYCKWQLDDSAKARKEKDGPRQDFTAAVAANPNNAAAWTMLGIFFQVYVKSSQGRRNAIKALRTAFEISVSELLAAERLAKGYADSGQWDLVELVAKRVVDSDASKSWPGSKKKAPSWPHAALGIVHINRQQYSLSIVSFQSALRINPSDYHSWVGLGESYLHSGRYVSAARAFSKAESIDHGLAEHETWFARYMLANVQKEMGVFDAAIESYEKTLEAKTNELGMLLALLQTFADNAWAKIAQALYGEGRKMAGRAIDVALVITQQRTDIFNLWKSVGDACAALAHVRSCLDTSVVSKIGKLLRTDASDSELMLFNEHDSVSIDAITCDQEPSKEDLADQCLLASVLAHKRGVQAASKDKHAQAVSWFNLGWAEHRAYAYCGTSLQQKGNKPKRFQTASMRCFKRAIELEASNADFWNALGVVTIRLNPNISQHSFVRSLNLNDNSTRSWTNLGVLYLINNDTQLANDAFTRAQSADPEYAEAWLGQGLVATLVGRLPEARGLFTHAFEISDGSLLAARRRYPGSIFDSLDTNSKHGNSVIGLLNSLLAVRQLHVMSPANVAASHLMALYAERVEDFDSAVTALEEVCDVLEVEYEKSESNEHLSRFAQAKADLARCQLGLHGFEGAIENAETVLDLTAEDDLGPAYAEIRQKSRLSAHLTAGLAHNHLQAIDKSIEMFQTALQDSPGEPDIICMLAQVLWAKGGSAEKDAARSQLLNAVSANPGHVQSVCLLAVIALSDDDEDMMGAVVDDLENFQMDANVSDADKLKVSQILAGIRLNKQEPAQKQIEQATVNIMLAPGHPQGWLELFEASGDENAADLARHNADHQLPPKGRLDAGDVASIYAGTGSTADMQLAKVMAPWMEGFQVQAS